MDEKQILETMTGVARSVLGLGTDLVLSGHTDLSEVVYIDSVRLMSFVVEIESAFGIEFPISELSGEAVTNVGQLTELVKQQVAKIG